ncbi:maestro heat-like repeat-containing protein family member 6, partial [Empidonax traillii]|uniref:maestro heat-like repeat-containing protein family member 6 n=1 Tax=Empidonax traillii TaxID=164674 RepID=UPI000FFDBBB8
MEQKRGWDTLLNADTQHYAVGLLAREMRRVSSPLCSPVALCLLGVLIREKPRWEVPAMAFLVEVSLLAKRMCSLSESLVKLLWDADVELVELALPIFLNMLQNKDILTSSPTALKLAEALRPLFDSDNSHVQILSIHLFQEVMKSVVDEGKKALKMHMVQNLLPLFLYWHDENQQVAQTSREALLCVAKFLKRKDLEQLLKTEQPLKFGECMLEKDRNRVANYLRQALPYLESPDEPVREAAIKFIGEPQGPCPPRCSSAP